MINFNIYKVEYKEIKTTYPNIYNEIFSHIDSNQMPDFIYVGFLDGKYVGFMSGYLHNKECIYLQYAGFVDSFKGYYAPKLFNDVVDYVHKEYKGIMFRIENTNIKAIKVALNAGFSIIGIRLDGVLYVELIKERKDAK